MKVDKYTKTVLVEKRRIRCDNYMLQAIIKEDSIFTRPNLHVIHYLLSNITSLLSFKISPDRKPQHRNS